MSNTRGRLVPLSVPLHTPQLALLRSLRAQADQLEERIQKLVKLEEQLKEIPDEPRWNALIPVTPSLSLAYARGNIKNTNTVMVHFDTAGEEDTSMGAQGRSAADNAQKGYWVEYSAKQARGVAERRRANLKPRLEQIQAAIKQAQGALSTEMGFTGGSINQNYELLNEEGLPFVEIQEFEEDHAPPVASTSASTSVQQSNSSTQAAVSSKLSPVTKTNVDEQKTPTSPPPKARKSVSFAQKDEYEPSPSLLKGKAKEEEDELPIIASQKAAASAGLPSALVSKTVEVERPAAPAEPVKPSMTSSFADLTLKSSIVVKDTTKPPPVLTAAERSARSKSKYDVAAEFDGVEAPKKVDLSAYLPRGLRGMPIAATFKGKARADLPSEPMPKSQNGDTSQTGAEANAEEDYEGLDGQLDESDDDGYYDDDLDDSDEDNTHIDDILAMREAAMEYHAKRHALGAGLGSGPLGGYGGADQFDEPGLSEYDKGGLPIVESYEDEEDGQRRPSRFRKSRFETAQMVIPEIKPGDVEVTETLLPGDSLGPFEDEETAVDPGAHGTNDFKGMSKEEIETFLRYVKALETGETLEDISVLPAGTDLASAPLPMDQVVPPSVKETVKKPEGASLKDSVVEKSAQKVVAPEVVAKAVEPPSEKPKRVSRFRAARGED